jgi:phage protein D
MNTITLKKSDYEILRKKAEVYDTIIRVVEEDIFTPPPIKSRN